MSLNYPHIAQMAFNTPLLATAQLADLVSTFLQQRLVDRGHQGAELSARETQSVAIGDPEVGESVTVIAVHGILIPRAGEINAACEEVMSYERLRSQLQRALNDDSVLEIVLDINSGGGTAQGAFECADFIYEARAKKPIKALVNFNAFSGAYLIAAACSEIILSETAGVGSIGVYQKRLDVTEHYAQEGVKIHTFFRGNRKVDFHPDIEMSDEEREYTEAGIEKTYQRFVNAVARYRNISAEEVEATQAECFEGEQAISLGLADTLSAPQDAFNNIIKSVVTRSQSRKIAHEASALTLL